MKTAVVVAAATLLSAHTCVRATEDVSGFVQLRVAHRIGSLPDCSLSGCGTMVEEGLAEVLLERRLASRWSLSVRAEAQREAVSGIARMALREGTIAWHPIDDLDLRIGRQIITWGVSDYLFVNDIFPKDYDAFFTGGSLDRMKLPVDSAHLTWHGRADVEFVLSRSKADRMPSASRFAIAGQSSEAVADEGEIGSDIDAALKTSAKWGEWDVAAYAARLRSREPRYFVDAAGLRADRPRMQHVGASATGNAGAGLVWVEAAMRHVDSGPELVADRWFLESSGNVLAGYSRDVADEVTASAQVQVEFPLTRGRYIRSLAPGIRPLPRLNSTLHLRLFGRGWNQTLGAGFQWFAGAEGDTHFNPFVNWSPADGWTIETGAHLFGGRADTRFGALRRDSNLYLTARFSY